MQSGLLDCRAFLECVTGLTVRAQEIDFGRNAVILVATGYPGFCEEDAAILGPLTIELRVRNLSSEA